MYTTVARFKKNDLEHPEVRAKLDGLREHLEGLALDSGLDPELNIRETRATDEGQEEVRLGISEEMDLYLREAPGEWRYY